MGHFAEPYIQLSRNLPRFVTNPSYGFEMTTAIQSVCCLIGAATAVLTLACKTDGGTGVTDIVRVDGSSTVYPITEAVAEEFQKGNAAKVTISVSGTGGGFKTFCAGETDISNASRPIKTSEVELCMKHGVEYVELPIAYDGLAILVNPRNDWANDITTAELKAIWEPDAQGKITRWRHVREEWPDKELHLCGAGVDSGTYDYFTEAIVHKEHASRGDFTSSEDDNVLVQCVANDELALGFFGYAYYAETKAKLKLLPVDDGNPQNGSGPIAPSKATVGEGTYQPLSRPIFIYVTKSAFGRPEVDDFLKFYLAAAPRLVDEVGYLPLPDAAYKLVRQRMQARHTGSVFGGEGSRVGVTIEALLTREQAAAR